MIMQIFKLKMYATVYFSGEKDVPAVVHPTVHLAGGGVAVQRRTKGGATVPTGHAAETGGNTAQTLTFCTVQIGTGEDLRHHSECGFTFIGFESF